MPAFPTLPTDDSAERDGDAEPAHPADRFEAGFRPLLRGR
jgi:hypothetical protein